MKLLQAAFIDIFVIISKDCISMTFVTFCTVPV